MFVDQVASSLAMLAVLASRLELVLVLDPVFKIHNKKH